MGAGEAAAVAAARVEAVRDSTKGRYRLAADFYKGPRVTSGCIRYADAELSFLRWEIERGVLNQPTGEHRGSPWWRAINDGLLRDKLEAELLAGCSDGSASSRNVGLWLEFMRAPSAASWYRAHNASIVAGYLEDAHLAASELAAERFMMNVALIRVMYAHALAAAPRLALGPFAPLGRFLGDPRRRSVRLFLDLRDQFPDRYPLDGWRLDDLVDAEGTVPRALDRGIIAPRLPELYEFAAAHLGEPRITTLICDGTPCYSWPAEDRALWLTGVDRPLARAVALATGRRHPAYMRRQP
jgi:hypothetical protein